MIIYKVCDTPPAMRKSLTGLIAAAGLVVGCAEPIKGPAPKIYAVDPNHGDNDSETLITITGENFGPMPPESIANDPRGVWAYPIIVKGSWYKLYDTPEKVYIRTLLGDGPDSPGYHFLEPGKLQVIVPPGFGPGKWNIIVVVYPYFRNQDDESETAAE